MKTEEKNMCQEILDVVNKYHKDSDGHVYESFVVFAIHDTDDELIMRALLHNVNLAMLLSAHKNLSESISERLKNLPEDDDIIH